MKTMFIEATNGPQNWGKFMLARLEPHEMDRPSQVSGGSPLLRQIGFNPRALFVFDLQTGEGAVFHPGGSAAADLDKHRIWVCPLFEPFLAWLYTQDLSDIGLLPRLIDLDAPFAFRGYRRGGGD